MTVVNASGPNEQQAEILALLGQGSIVEARSRIDAILSDQPDDPFALGILAQLLSREGRHIAAIRITTRLRELQPDDADVLRLHFDQLVLDARYTEAYSLLDQLPSEIRNRSDVRVVEADLAGKIGDHRRELELLTGLLEENKDEPGFRAGRAQALRSLGLRDEAVASLEDLTRTRPQFGSAWWLLSDIKDYRFSDEQVSILENLISESQPVRETGSLHFALARAYHDRERFEEAFRHFRIANELSRRADVSARESEDRLAKIAQRFASDLLQNQRTEGGNLDDARRPVFIVGMHRSGSTLIEQILNSHSLIEGLSELPVLPQIAREILGDTELSGQSLLDRILAASESKLEQFANLYWERARSYAKTDAPIIVDKLPGNWRRSGLILTLFPNARIVDARRHPMATAWSNFTHNYGRPTEFSNDLMAFAAHYRGYLRFMEELKPAAGNRLATFLNERIIADSRTEIERLLTFIGVELEDTCLAAHSSTNPVRTPSAEQVRRPINADGLDRWRDYQPWLTEVEHSFGDALKRWQD